ncbi:hypothetical protein OPV22_024708 [Ensete ventricosum]|uniref:Uncharacterized protein n=1 Tax=Ensete ventricosum TaxID=4639 RepID=A0AAV8Q7T5_ENSVE|nr:hypothetical protein OPV22_024708 [Ensete ventricosum]
MADKPTRARVACGGRDSRPKALTVAHVTVCLFVWFAPMGLLSKGSISLVILILLLVSCCDGSRTMHAWYQTPAGKKKSGGFFEFLPRAMPIPPSGPSKRHNSIGLHGQTTP